MLRTSGCNGVYYIFSYNVDYYYKYKLYIGTYEILAYYYYVKVGADVSQGNIVGKLNFVFLCALVHPLTPLSTEDRGIYV